MKLYVLFQTDIYPDFAHKSCGVFSSLEETEAFRKVCNQSGQFPYAEAEFETVELNKEVWKQVCWSSTW